MEHSEDQPDLELHPDSSSNDQWVDVAVLTENSDQLMERISSRLDDLNTVLDRLEERTDRVLEELRLLVGTESQRRRAHDGCGDPGADE